MKDQHEEEKNLDSLYYLIALGLRLIYRRNYWQRIYLGTNWWCVMGLLTAAFFLKVLVKGP